MPRPRPRERLHVRLQDGPCRGREFTIPRKLWDYGVLFVAGELERPWQAEETATPWSSLPPTYAYRRVLMGYRPTGKDEKPRYWYEWHYETPNRRN